MGYNFKRIQRREQNGGNSHGPCNVKFVCELLMVESVKCATKRTTKRSKDLVDETHLRPKDSNVRPTHPLSEKSSADKSASSVLKISVDLWPVLSMAIEPFKIDQTEFCNDELQNEKSVQTNEIKMAKHLKEARSTMNQKVHKLDKPLGSTPRPILPPLKSSDILQFESPKSIKPCFRPTLPPIAVSVEDPLGFAHAKSIVGKEYDEPRSMKTDVVKNILNQNMVPQLELPDISVSSIQMLIERVERQLDRGKVKLPEIKLPQTQREKAEISARTSHRPPVHEKNMNQPIILRFHKKPQSPQWSVNKSTLHF